MSIPSALAPPNKAPIDVRVNLNTLLCHHVDSLSQWDYSVGKHIRDWHCETFEISPNDEEILKIYRDERARFGW